MSDETVTGPPTRYTVEAGVATITLDRPDNRNALSVELMESLADDLDRAAADDTVRVIVLTNTGSTFCAGADLKAAEPGVGAAQPGVGAAEPGGEGGRRRTLVEVLEQILGAPKPVIGRVDGHATGGGVGLAAACDLSVMRDDAKIGFTEVRLGVAPAVISVVCLPKMRRADASELFLTGEPFTPTRAADVGLINAAVPADGLDTAVDRWVTMVARGGPEALAACKELIRRVPAMERGDAFEWTAARSDQLFRSDEATAGIAAFRERRDPPWVP